MASHKAHFARRDDFTSYWKLHNLFRNPKVKRVLIKCGVCHPKKKVQVKKVGRIWELDNETA